MKTSRRGGLGRGLGALIQSTVEAPEENAEASSPKDSAVPVKSGPKAAAAAEATTTSTRSTATTETSGKSSDPAPSASQRKTTGGAAQVEQNQLGGLQAAGQELQVLGTQASGLKVQRITPVDGTGRRAERVGGGMQPPPLA